MKPLVISIQADILQYASTFEYLEGNRVVFVAFSGHPDPHWFNIAARSEWSDWYRCDMYNCHRQSRSIEVRSPCGASLSYRASSVQLEIPRHHLSATLHTDAFGRGLCAILGQSGVSKVLFSQWSWGQPRSGACRVSGNLHAAQPESA